MNIQQMRKDPTVHFFTRQIVEAAQLKDPVDAVADIELALEILNEEHKEWKRE